MISPGDSPISVVIFTASRTMRRAAPWRSRSPNSGTVRRAVTGAFWRAGAARRDRACRRPGLSLDSFSTPASGTLGVES